MKKQNQIQADSTPRPLLGEIVEIPANLYAPKRYDDQGRDVRVTVGRVVEEHPTLVAVQFFGYPHTVDYTRREAGMSLLAGPIVPTLQVKAGRIATVEELENLTA